MYRILHVTSGEFLPVPALKNKDEADKMIYHLIKLYKQAKQLTLRSKHPNIPYFKMLVVYDSLCLLDLEAVFVSEKVRRYKIMDIASLATYSEYYPTEKHAIDALAKALRKQHKDLSLLRKWCLTHIPAASVLGSLFDNFKTDWTNKTGHFKVIEV